MEVENSNNTSITCSQTVVQNVTAQALPSLAELAEERKQWEVNVYRTSNQQLYALLAKCYAYYQGMDGEEDAAKQRRAHVREFAAKHSLRFVDGTHCMTRVLKCVFYNGAQAIDRRRISTYSIVLRAALAQGLAADQVANFIESNGGVQEIRLSQAKGEVKVPMSELVRNSLNSLPVLARLRDSELTVHIKADDHGKTVALLAEVQSTGEFVVRAIIRNLWHVNQALAAHRKAAANDSHNKAVA